MNSLNFIKNHLKKKQNKKFCFLTGSGTSALFLLFKSLNLNKSDYVLLPSITCFAPAYAIKYAGLNLALCDIDISSGLMDLNYIKDKIEENKKIKVVVAIHSFGNCIKDTKQIKRYCKRQGIILVEDIAQSYGNKIKGEYCGSFAEHTIMSFGNDKILENKFGGALLTNDEKIYKSVEFLEKKISEYDRSFITKNYDAHRKQYYKIKDNICSGDYINKKLDLWRFYKKLFVYKFDFKYIESLKGLIIKEQEILNHRKIILNTMIEEFSTIDNLFIVSQPDTIPWRFTFLLNRLDINNELAKYLRKHKINASTWFPNLQYFFQETLNLSLPNADDFNQSVVNLKLDGDNKFIIEKIIQFQKKCKTRGYYVQ